MRKSFTMFDHKELYNHFMTRKNEIHQAFRKYKFIHRSDFLKKCNLCHLFTPDSLISSFIIISDYTLC